MGTFRRPGRPATREQNNRRTSFHHCTHNQRPTSKNWQRERRHSLGHALDTTRTTHDASTAGDDDGFGTTTMCAHNIVMIAPRVAIEVAIAIDVFFIDRCFFALDGGDRRRG